MAVEGGEWFQNVPEHGGKGFKQKRIQRKGFQKIKTFQNFLDHDKVNYLVPTNFFWDPETDGLNRAKRYVLIWEEDSG